MNFWSRRRNKGGSFIRWRWKVAMSSSSWWLTIGWGGKEAGKLMEWRMMMAMVDNIWVWAMCCRRKIGGSFMWRGRMKAMCDSTCNLVIGCRSLRTRIRTERPCQLIKNGQQGAMFLFDNCPQRSFWSLMNSTYWKNSRIAIRLSIYTFTFLTSNNPVQLSQCILYSPSREKKSENVRFSDCTRFSILKPSFETFSALGLLPIPDRFSSRESFKSFVSIKKWQKLIYWQTFTDLHLII